MLTMPRAKKDLKVCACMFVVRMGALSTHFVQIMLHQNSFFTPFVNRQTSADDKNGQYNTIKYLHGLNMGVSAQNFNRATPRYEVLPC